MSSSILPSSNYFSANLPDPQALQNRRSEWRQLNQSIASGDLSGAGQAFQSISSQSTQNSPLQSSALSQDWSALGQAIQSGDASGAKQALSKLQQDFQSQVQSANPQQSVAPFHRHHHHAHVPPPTDDSTNPASTGPTDANGPTVTGGGFGGGSGLINVVA